MTPDSTRQNHRAAVLVQDRSSCPPFPNPRARGSYSCFTPAFGRYPPSISTNATALVARARTLANFGWPPSTSTTSSSKASAPPFGLRSLPALPVDDDRPAQHCGVLSPLSLPAQDFCSSPAFPAPPPNFRRSGLADPCGNAALAWLGCRCYDCRSCLQSGLLLHVFCLAQPCLRERVYAQGS